MNEIKRQIVVFGDFSSITFNAQVELGNILNKFGLKMSVTQDILAGVPVQTVNNMIPNIEMRPVFMTEDKNFSLFIGTKRIHIEQIGEGAMSFDDFLARGKEIVSTILDVYKVNFNRLALNGRLSSYDKIFVDSLYGRIFNPSVLYGDSSEEFSFRINNVDCNQELNSNINKIISLNRTKEILPDNNLTSVVIIDYDFNTVYDLSKTFTYENLEFFLNEACEFREVILNYEKS